MHIEQQWFELIQAVCSVFQKLAPAPCPAMFRVGLIRAVHQCSHHFRMCRGVSGTEVCQAVTAGLSTFNQGLKMWQLQSPKPEQQKHLPPLHLDIQSPPVGTKKIPAGIHPLPYLRALPELKGQNLDDSRLTYFGPDLNSDVAITSEQDWMLFMQKASASDGTAPRLVLHCTWSLKKRAQQKMSDVSEKIRQWSKSLLLNKDSQDAEIERLS